MVNLQAANVSSPLGLSLNTSANPSSTFSSQEFTKALSDAIAGTLERFGIDPGSVSLNFGSNTGQSVRQTSVPSQISAAAAIPAASTAQPAPALSGLGFNALIPKDNVGQPASIDQPAAPVASPLASPLTSPPISSVATQHWYAADPVDDAYWSKQPAAVQQLREVDDLSQRQALAARLASQGYQIDVPVMVWGWDAGKTTSLRQTFGYTWVPSALQQPVSAAPGLQGAGIVPYDPNHPPQGSIQV